jgi:stage II sporulation protein D
LAVFSVLLFSTPVVFALAHGGSDIPDKTELSYEFPRTVSLLLTETEEILQISITDYLIGCLFAQIPVTYHEQALNAQAVAAHTYLLRLLHDGVVISDDPAVCQPFFTEERARSHYGDEYDKYLTIVTRAARYGSRRAIFHDDEPIHAVYHAISAGVTNTAHSVWGQDFPYLRSVESSWDREHPSFSVVNEIPSEEIRLAMFAYNRTASMPVDFARWFVNPIKNEYGYVISVRVGDTLLSGGDMWRIFELRSTSFELSFRSGGIFVVETRGFGHGVGLSQHGADVLGRRGFTSEDILAHYYTDAVIKET